MEKWYDEWGLGRQDFICPNCSDYEVSLQMALKTGEAIFSKVVDAQGTPGITSRSVSGYFICAVPYNPTCLD